MKKRITEIKDIQKIELELLKKISAFMDCHHIRYFLAGGSMLGAVRHNGFIPWDDDIDLLVPREDYNKLRTLIQNEVIQIPHVEFALPGNDNSFWPFIKMFDTRTKIVGMAKYTQKDLNEKIWIDIFPLDHFPDTAREHKRVLFKNWLLRYILTYRTHIKGVSKKEHYFLFWMAKATCYYLLGGYKNIIRRIDRDAEKMNERYIDSNHLGDGTWPENEKDYFEENMVTPLMLHDFEDARFYIPVNYDGYLTSFYGDYMTPPPEDKRMRHSFEAYYITD